MAQDFIDYVGGQVSRTARRWAWFIAILMVIAYFSAQAMVGRYGWPAHQRLSAQIAEAQAELATLQIARETLAAAVRDLKHDGMHPDALETQLRRLGYVGERELILFWD